MSFSWRRILVLSLLLALSLDLCVSIVSCQSTPAREDHAHHHHGGGCDHSHGHDHHHHHHHHHHDDHDHGVTAAAKEERKLPEELAEEEDMRLCGFGPCVGHIPESSSRLSGFALWFNALGCSLLVSLASLICLIILPFMFVQGKPSKWLVDALALFGAGAMLGDAFLHQLPHAFGGGHSHSHDHHTDHAHHDHSHLDSHSSHSHSHSHSLEDLSVGLSVLGGILLFLLVEKLVRYVEENSSGSNAWGHHHHHHHHHKSDKKKKDKTHNNSTQQSSSGTTTKSSEKVSDGSLDGSLRKRKTSTGDATGNSDSGALATSDGKLEKTEPVQTHSNLVFGYLNLFSDGVHNFTDGMALGSAFLIYGTVGGWSRTVFLLAHELPQEIGDFGILVRSGFTVTKALFFNFLSALVALAGTAMVLLWGNEPGQSSLIEGFTAGGFIYIAVAGVLAEMNNTCKSTLKNTACHLISLVLGMSVALCISLFE
ncbi:PREDICTED: IAA-alanine resistance protein 1 [Tarenaya hassleriana]|uniref:IAA-alanine resistance protein 1 n=1 Tax=Tarenaya hassleriana TaxID=28532 RepID=UPI00053C83EA|nr:PREDICTED: IAA-alanine resistance protein 1 [Tarenaya hassleriana]